MTARAKGNSITRGAASGNGFTLVEILISTAIMALATAIAASTFFVVSRAYRHGTALTENLHYGDFLMDQLVLGLRSAYHPERIQGRDSAYGFWLENGGTGPYARDRISWVKTGRALVGEQSDIANVPHRVDFGLETGDDGDTIAVVRAWRTAIEPDDFDPETAAPIVLSRRVTGFECRIATNVNEIHEELLWENEWDATNRIPPAVALTLYLQPLEEKSDPIRIERAIGIPIAPLSW